MTTRNVIMLPTEAQLRNDRKQQYHRQGKKNVSRDRITCFI